MKGKQLKKLKVLVVAVLFAAIAAYMLIATAIASFTETVDTSKVKNKLELSLEKFVNYNVDDQKGALLQFDVKTGIEYEEGVEKVPALATGVFINAPKINDKFPESLEVISKDANVKYSLYDAQTGEIKIVTLNLDKVQRTDNYSIILNYGENCYVEEVKAQELNITGKIQSKLDTEEDLKIQEEFEQKVNLEKEVSNLISSNIKTTEIYNGFMKMNSKSDKKYATDYDENIEINISKKELSDKTKVEITNEFAKEEENIYKSTKINKNKVLDIVGEDGYLKILDKDQKVLGEINKDTEVDDDGNYQINYEGDITKLFVEFSKPKKVGYIEINSSKQIKETVTDLSLNKMKITSKINGINVTETNDEEKVIYSNEDTKEVEIKDSKTTVKLNINEAKWTNEKQNELIFNVKLLASQSAHNLFKNPSIQIKLPDEVEKVVLDKESIIYGNGLKVKSVDYNKDVKTINLVLEGEQKEYLQNGVSDGTSISIPANVILKQDMESKDVKVNVNYSNAATDETGNFDIGVSVENFKEEEETQDNTITEAASVARQLKSAARTANSQTNSSETITAEGIGMEVTPIRGDVALADGDIVYEGEFIKYNITLTNTTDATIDNVKVVASIPEGATYGELVREDNEPYVESYYNYDKELRTKEINVGTIAAGKTSTVYYEVRVNDLAQEETTKDISTNIKTYIEDGVSDDYNVTYKVEKAEYKVQLSSYVYRSGVFKYRLKIEGESEEEIPVKIVFPEYMGAYNLVDESDLSKSIEFDNISKLSANLKPGNYLIYVHVINNKIPYKTGKSSLEASTVATVNEKYKSNENRILLEYDAITVEMSSSTASEEVKYGEEINYEIKIKNIGRTNYRVNNSSYIQVKLTDSLPNELKPIEAKYNNYEINDQYDSNNNESKLFIEKEERIDLTQKAIDENGNVLPFSTNLLNIPYGETITIEIKTKADIVDNVTPIVNEAIVSQETMLIYDTTYSTIINPVSSNKVTHTILPIEYEEEPDEPVNPEEPDEPVNPDEPDEPVNPDKPDEPVNPDEPDEPVNPEEPDEPVNPDDSEKTDAKKHTISGFVWNDDNGDGEKQSNEKLISGVKTYLITSEGDLVETTYTGDNGDYSFKDIETGNYIVLFKYDNSKYKITKYKANGVKETVNSDANNQDVTIGNEKMTAGVTDIINVESDVSNINIGLIENKRFDMKIDSYITKVTVITSSETTETPYSNVDLAKTEIKAKEIEGATITIEYKIVISNNGEVPGTVGKIIDYIPNGLNISQDLKTTWSNNNDGSFVNTSLSGQKIEPGETKELTLKLTRQLTEDSTGSYTNKIQIDNIQNDYGIMDLNNDNNNSETNVIVSISTGAIIYISIAFIIIIIGIIVLNIKFNMFKRIRIIISGILGIFVVIIFVQANYPVKASGIPIGLTETHRIFLTAGYAHPGDRWREVRSENVNAMIYGDSTHVSSINTNNYLQFFVQEDRRYRLFEVEEPGASYGNEINYTPSAQDANYMINTRNYKNGVKINSKTEIPYIYMQRDWRAFYELADGDDLVYNPSTGSYTWQGSGSPQYFGQCIERNANGGERAIYVDNIGFDAEPFVQNGAYNGNLNAYTPITSTWTCTGNYWDFTADGTGLTTYGYIVDDRTVRPTFNLSGNNSTEVNIKNIGSNDCLIGPLSIYNNDQNTTYTFKIIGKYGNINNSEITICNSNGNAIASPRGRFTNIYLRVNKDRVKNIEQIYKVALETSGVAYRHEVHYTTQGKKVFRSAGYQEVASGSGPEIEPIIETLYDKAPYEWGNFKGAFYIEKDDQIGYSTDGQKLDLSGITFVVNRLGYGWVYADGNGNYTGEGSWNMSKMAKLKTYKSGEKYITNGLTGLPPTPVEGDDGPYAIFEVIKGPNNSIEKDRPDLLDYYKESDEERYPGWLKSTGSYKLKLVEYKKQGGVTNPTGRRIFSGEYWKYPVTNSRDYVSLQIQKKDELNRQSNLNLQGIKFKIFKGGSFGNHWLKFTRDSDGNYNVTSETASFNEASELTTSSDGSTPVLDRLVNGEFYRVYETYVPSRLMDYYNDDDTISIPSAPYNIKVKNKVINENTGELISEGDDFIATASNHGLYTLKANNKRDKISVRIHKTSEEGRALQNVGFAILDVTDANKYEWVITQSTNGGGYAGLTSDGKLDKNNRFMTFRTNSQGYTNIIKRLPVGRKYNIYEVDLGPYDELYKLDKDGVKYNYKSSSGVTSTIKLDGTWVGTIDTRKDGFNNFVLEGNITKSNITSGNTTLYDAFTTSKTNEQYYGALNIVKKDELTQVPLEGIGFKIRINGNGKDGWLKLNKITNSNGTVYEMASITSSFNQATVVYTNSSGITDDIIKLPIGEKTSTMTVPYNYFAYEVEIPQELQKYYTLDQTANVYAERFVANTVSQAILINNSPINLTRKVKSIATRHTINYTESVVKTYEGKNIQRYITLSGKVWEDGKQGKSSKTINHEYNRSVDYNVQGIYVRLVDSEGKPVYHTDPNGNNVTSRPITATTDSNGEYRLENVRIDKLSSYRIEFSYDGITYNQVNKNLEGNSHIIVGSGSNSRNVNIPKDNTSKADETTDLRNKLNESFAQVTGQGQQISYNGKEYTIGYTTKNGENNRVYSTNLYNYNWERTEPSNGNSGRVKVNPNSNNLNVTSTISGNYINDWYKTIRGNLTNDRSGYNKNKKELLKEIPNLNLGLYQREEGDLFLKKDIYAAEVSINGKKYIYKYGARIDTESLNEIEQEYRKNVKTTLGVAFENSTDGDDYTLPVHQADLVYETSGDLNDTGRSTENDGELKVTLTYAIALGNNTKDLYSKVNRVKEYYSTDMKLASSQIYADKECKTPLEGAKIENVTTTDAITLYDQNTAQIYNTFDINLKDTNLVLNPVIDTNGGMTKYIYVKMELPKATFYDFRNNVLYGDKVFRNYAEISSYTLYSEPNKTYAHFDYDSVPNTIIKNQSTSHLRSVEDDAKVAPGLKLSLAEQRTLTGVVFEDTVNEAYREAKLRLGDGIRDTLETNEKGIANVTVQLVPMSKITSNGANHSPEFQNITAPNKDEITRYYNSVGLANTSTITTKTDENGRFTLQGFIPGDYQIRYIWGNSEGTTLKDGTKVNVGEYKSTTYRQTEIGDNKWYLYENVGGDQGDINYSEAIDCYQERINIDKDLPTTYGDYDTYTSALADRLNVSMNSWTRKLDMGIEVVGEIKNNNIGADSDNTSNIEVFKDPETKQLTFNYNISSIDLGLIERPKQQLEIYKELKGFKIIDAQDRVIVDAKIIVDESTGKRAFENATEIPYSVFLPESDIKPTGQAKTEIDKDYMPLRLEATYEVKVSNTGEKDYSNALFYYFGMVEGTNAWQENPVTQQPKVYDYLSKSFDIEDVGNFKIKSLEDYNKDIEDITDQRTNLYSAGGSSKTIVEAGFGRYKSGTNTLPDGTVVTEEDWSNYKILKYVYEKWYQKVSETVTVRNVKLDGKKSMELLELEKPYEAGTSAVCTYTVSTVITDKDEIELTNQAEIVSAKREQETGNTKIETYKPFYYEGEEIIITPPTGENRETIATEENHTLAIAIISGLTTLGIGIVFIKKVLLKKNK